MRKPSDVLRGLEWIRGKYFKTKDGRETNFLGYREEIVGCCAEGAIIKSDCQNLMRMAGQYMKDHNFPCTALSEFNDFHAKDKDEVVKLLEGLEAAYPKVCS